MPRAYYYGDNLDILDILVFWLMKEYANMHSTLRNAGRYLRTLRVNI
jgi:hypothetical protein